ncbi:MAG: hypothetical protein HYV09_32170 [Deltaproteobacteria bacterium]|nr:hypothetical protein [Deltaproteobacteria bacterium]
MARSICMGIGAIAAFALVACGGGRVRDADAPLSPAAAKVQVLGAAQPTCKKIGSVNGIGEDLDEKVSDAQALKAAKEEAAKLGGDSIVIVTTASDVKAGAGGTVQVITKTADVFDCAAK